MKLTPSQIGKLRLLLSSILGVSADLVHDALQRANKQLPNTNSIPATNADKDAIASQIAAEMAEFSGDPEMAKCVDAVRFVVDRIQIDVTESIKKLEWHDAENGTSFCDSGINNYLIRFSTVLKTWVVQTRTGRLPNTYPSSNQAKGAAWAHHVDAVLSLFDVGTDYPHSEHPFLKSMSSTGWIVTDPDNFQFARKEINTRWIYAQVNLSDVENPDLADPSDLARHLVVASYDIADATPEEIANTVAPYYPIGEFEAFESGIKAMLFAECKFELEIASPVPVR